MTRILYDGDCIAYKAALAAETAYPLSEGPFGHISYICTLDTSVLKEVIDNVLERVRDVVESNEATNRFFLTGSKNFRHNYLPTYKHERKDIARPLGLGMAKQYLVDEYGAEAREGFEADDLIGIAATEGEDAYIVAEDKDFQTIPDVGLINLWPHSDEEFLYKRTTKASALAYFYRQVIEGDRVDGYLGCPSFGPVKTESWLNKRGVTWEAVVAAYESKGLTEADALVQARCAHILHARDLDNNGYIIDWEPYPEEG